MELVGYEDDEARSPTSFSSWVVHVCDICREEVSKQGFVTNAKKILLSIVKRMRGKDEEN